MEVGGNEKIKLKNRKNKFCKVKGSSFHHPRTTVSYFQHKIVVGVDTCHSLQGFQACTQQVPGQYNCVCPAGDDMMLISNTGQHWEIQADEAGDYVHVRATCNPGSLMYNIVRVDPPSTGPEINIQSIICTPAGTERPPRHNGFFFPVKDIVSRNSIAR